MEVVGACRVVLAIVCVCYGALLAWHEKEGWGWMIFLALAAIPAI